MEGSPLTIGHYFIYTRQKWFRSREVWSEGEDLVNWGLRNTIWTSPRWQKRYYHSTMAKFQWEVRHSEFWTLPLILSASKYFRLISLSFYPHPNISDKFLCHFIFVEDKMNNRPYPRYTCWGTKWTVVKHSLLFISQ